MSVVLLFLQEQFIQISHKTFNSQTLLIDNKPVKNIYLIALLAQLDRAPAF